VLFQAQINICKCTPFQRGDSNLQQAKVTASAVSKLSHLSNNPYIKLWNGVLSSKMLTRQF